MNKVILIIGLPGSGKTTLINHYLSHPFEEYTVYDDWMKWIKDDVVDKEEFTADVNYEKMVDKIRKGENVIISAVGFCRPDFLLKSEYYLKMEFPDIDIERVYFENNLENCISNIKYRDKEEGGYWKTDENGKVWYIGMVINGIPFFQFTIETAKTLHKKYVIPNNVTPYKVKNIDGDNT